MSLFRVLLFLTFVLPAYHSGKAQNILNDLEMQKIIRDGIDYSYNFEFSQAEARYQQVKEKYPDHPAYPFLMSLNLYWKMIYYNNYKEKSPEYLALLNKSSLLTNKMLEKNSKNTEAIFFAMGSYSYLSLYYAQNKETMKTISTAKKAYDYMKLGFGLKDQSPEFYFSTGLYNYYAEQYPETHPVYKPFMLFFSKGNKETGISELDHASRYAVFTRTESLYYLTNIFLKYEDKPASAYPYSEQLAVKYPNNLYFIMRHIESLIGTMRFEEAEKLNYRLSESGQKFFEMASYVFSGMINEKFKKRDEHAKAFYLRAVTMAPEVEFPTNDYLGFAYAGLARIADRRNEKEKAKSYYEKALKAAEYTGVKREAENYLKK